MFFFKYIIAEINLYKKKWALLGIYHPPSQDESRFYHELGKAIDYMSRLLKTSNSRGSRIG